MSLKSSLLYDMDYITKEIDNIDTKELEEIYTISQRFANIISSEVWLRNNCEDEF